MPFGSSGGDWSGIGADVLNKDWSTGSVGGNTFGDSPGLVDQGLNWLHDNQKDIQSALKGSSALTGSGGSSSSGSGVRTDVSAQSSLHQGQAGTISDLFQQLMARRAAAQTGGGRASGGLLGM